MKKREGFRKAFENFEIEKVANFDEYKIQKLLLDTSIIRNQLKIRATINNAQQFIKIQKEFGSFDKYMWLFTGNTTKVNKWISSDQIPATNSESDAMSKDLKKRGFKFVGSTICYAYMQAAGMVNDHLIGCFRYKQI